MKELIRIVNIIGWSVFAFIAILILAFTMNGCQAQPQQAQSQNPPVLPVEDNFRLPQSEAQKLWTEADFQQAEAQARTIGVDYLNPMDGRTGDLPAMITEQDKALITHYTQQRLTQLIAEASK